MFYYCKLYGVTSGILTHSGTSLAWQHKSGPHIVEGTKSGDSMKGSAVRKQHSWKVKISVSDH